MLKCPHCDDETYSDDQGFSVGYSRVAEESGRLFLEVDGSVCEWKDDGEDLQKIAFFCRSCNKTIKAEFVDGIFTIAKKQ